jgi:parvulin-like peptidyl-prolyl isomerase
MLKKLRNKKTAKKVWIVLAILIVPAFVLWGSGSLMRNREESGYVGIIFGRKISLLEYQDALEATRNQAMMQFGENFSEMQKSLNLQYQAWERLILLHEAKKRRINAGDAEVIESIESYPFLQLKGRFSERIYSEMLRYVFHSQPRIFEEQIRQNLMLSKLYKQVTEKINISEEEVRKEYRKANEEISLYYIAGLPSEFAKGITASDGEIKDYFARNTLEFKQPLSFNLDYISSESENKIKTAASRLNRKSDFEKIAKETGLFAKETGLFAQTEPIPGIGWSPEILNLISKLNIGQYSPVLQIDKNFYILRLKEKKEAYIPEFDKIKEKVRERLLKDGSEKIAKEKIEEAFKKLKELYASNPKSADFAKTAKEYGLKLDSTALFKYGSYIEGIGASDIFWINALDLKGEEFSQVISVPSGFYIVKLKDRIGVDEKKFESDKEEFSKKALLAKKQEYFTLFLEELKRKAQ